MVLVLEVGSIPGSREEGCEPDLSCAAGSGDVGTSVMLMPACGGEAEKGWEREVTPISSV